MAIDPSALIAPPVQMPKGARTVVKRTAPVPGGRNVDFGQLPNPNDPNAISATTQPPEPDGIALTTDAKGNLVWHNQPEEVDGESAPAVAEQLRSSAPAGAARLVIGFGPEKGTVVLAIERPPDWDVECSLQASADAVRQVLPILKQFGKVKDLTGGFADAY